MQIGLNLPPGQGHERSTSAMRRSKVKVKVTGGRSYIWQPGGVIVLDPVSRVDRGISWIVLILKGGATVLKVGGGTILLAPLAKKFF